MKKLITLILISSLMLAVCGCSAPVPETPRNYYAMVTVVADVHDATMEVECVDFNGNVWVFFQDADEWSIGDYCAMLMDNNGTESIYDDVIVSVEYSGWVEGSFGWNGHEAIFEP